jgi:hypothetical protein
MSLICVPPEVARSVGRHPRSEYLLSKIRGVVQQPAIEGLRAARPPPWNEPIPVAG